MVWRSDRVSPPLHQNAVTGDQDRQGIGTAGLPDSLWRNAKILGQIAIVARFPKGNRRQGAPHLRLKSLAPLQRQIKDTPLPGEIFRQLLQSGEFQRPCDRGRVPVQRDQTAAP